MNRLLTVRDIRRLTAQIDDEFWILLEDIPPAQCASFCFGGSS
jgi:hypothetical protein